MPAVDLNLALFHALNLGPASPVWLMGLARFSSTVLPAVALLGALVLLPWRGAAGRRALAAALLAVLLAWLVARGLSAAWPTPRPFALGLGHQGLAHKATASFPSSHASVAFSFGLALWARWPCPWGGGLPLLLAALVAWSRVALGLHFPVDVLAGALVGGLSAWLALRGLAPRVPVVVAPESRDTLP